MSKKKVDLLKSEEEKDSLPKSIAMGYKREQAEKTI